MCSSSSSPSAEVCVVVVFVKKMNNLSGESAITMQHISHTERAPDSQFHSDLHVKLLWLIVPLPLLRALQLGPTKGAFTSGCLYWSRARSAHDRDFPLGARWGGWCKSERATLRRGHHSSFHLSPPGEKDSSKWKCANGDDTRRQSPTPNL